MFLAVCTITADGNWTREVFSPTSFLQRQCVLRLEQELAKQPHLLARQLEVFPL